MIAARDALSGELVEIRRLVKGASVAREVCPAEVVGEDHDDVGFVRMFCFGGLQRSQRREQEDGEEDGFHGLVYFCLASVLVAAGGGTGLGI
jgi:hypothetical protein